MTEPKTTKRCLGYGSSDTHIYYLRQLVSHKSPCLQSACISSIRTQNTDTISLCPDAQLNREAIHCMERVQVCDKKKHAYVSGISMPAFYFTPFLYITTRFHRMISERSAVWNPHHPQLSPKHLVLSTPLPTCTRKAKLTGRDFDHSIFERGFRANKKDTLEVEDQVSVLIEEATAVENLCQCYIGWCPFW